MLDRKYILENVELVKKNCLERGAKVDVDRFMALESFRKEKQTQIDEFNRLANEVSKSIDRKSVV